MRRTVAIVATLDTKAEETAYLKRLIEEQGLATFVVDTGILSDPPLRPDAAADEVARAAGSTLAEVRALSTEGEAIGKMTVGASKLVGDLYASGSVHAVVGLGGSMGTSVGLAVMRSLPTGVPKLMVSTIGFSPLVTPGAVASDQVMLQVPVDLWGLNALNRYSLEMAAAAIGAMARASRKIEPSRPLVAVTTRGILHYLHWIKPALETRGYEVVVIHAVGTVGGGTFEELVRQGLFVAVLDLCTGEVIEELCGGALRAGPARLDAAGEMGIPQVVAPGCMEFFHWPGPADTLPAGRRTHTHNPLVIGVKATLEEMLRAAEVVAQKLRSARGPVKLVFPLGGWDLHDQPGHVFHDPEGRAAFLDRLKRKMGNDVELLEVGCHINDQAFADKVMEVFDELMHSS